MKGKPFRGTVKYTQTWKRDDAICGTSVQGTMVRIIPNELCGLVMVSSLGIRTTGTSTL